MYFDDNMSGGETGRGFLSATCNITGKYTMEDAFFQDLRDISALLPQRLRTSRRLSLLFGLSEEEISRRLDESPEELRDEEGAMEPPDPHPGDPLPLTGPAHAGSPLAEALRLFREERVIDGAEVLARWIGYLCRNEHIWVVELCIRCILSRLVRFSFARSGIREMERYMELCLALQPVAAFYAVEPEQMERVILRARVAAHKIGDRQAFRLLNTVFETQVMLDPRGYPYYYLSEPDEKGTGLVGLAEDRVYKVNAALFFGVYHLLMGHPRLALDHFSLRSPTPPEEPHRDPVEAIYAPFEAVATAMTGEFHRARALLTQELQAHRKFRHSAVKRMLQIRLADVLLDMGETEAALEHIDAVMDGVSLGGHVPGWLAAHVLLARYHLISGRAGHAWIILEKSVRICHGLGYEYSARGPSFLNMLYAFRQKGLPDIPHYAFDGLLKQSLNGANLTMRFVALRIRAHQILRNGQHIRRVYPLLRKCRNFFVMYGLEFEAAETNSMLADAYLKAGDRKFALRYAIEAWPVYARYPALRGSWPPGLHALIPHAHTEKQRLAGNAESCLRQLTRVLLELDPLECEQFPLDLLGSVCRVFGASRGVLWRVPAQGRPKALYAHGLTREQAEGSAFAARRRIVEESCDVIPFHVVLHTEAEKKTDSGDDIMAVVVPLPLGQETCHTVYFEGGQWLWSEEYLTENTLVQLGEMLAVLVRRWLQRQGQGNGRREEPPVQEEDGFIYQSESMRDFLRKVDSAATADVSMLIYGESGVGKELIARRIHRMSRRPGPFVAVNLSSLPEELFESEMQGYERGAFTGANQQKIGLLELAHRGTLFIDEVPDVSPRVQVKLLRLLQERSFMRLGSTRVIHSDFRLVVATNKDLKEEVRQGRFRSDLFYRICVISLHVPPLRERREDIPALAAYYLEEFAGKHRRNKPNLGAKEREKLYSYNWPGNVRELRNVMEQAVILSTEGKTCLALDERGGGVEEREQPLPAMYGDPAPLRDTAPSPRSFLEVMDGMLAAFPSIDELEEHYIREVLRVTNGRISGKQGAASLLGISRATLYEKLRRFGAEAEGASVGKEGKPSFRK